jgi:hypothetical protein
MTIAAASAGTATSVGGSASITTTVKGQDGDQVEDAFNITSQTLNLTASNTNNVAAVNIDLIWGTF